MKYYKKYYQLFFRGIYEKTYFSSFNFTFYAASLMLMIKRKKTLELENNLLLAHRLLMIHHEELQKTALREDKVDVNLDLHLT